MVCSIFRDEYALMRIIRVIDFFIVFLGKQLLPVGAAALWGQRAQLLLSVGPLDGWMDGVDRSCQDDGLELAILVSITAGISVRIPKVSIRIGRRPRIPAIRHHRVLTLREPLWTESIIPNNIISFINRFLTSIFDSIELPWTYRQPGINFHIRHALPQFLGLINRSLQDRVMPAQ